MTPRASTVTLTALLISVLALSVATVSTEDNHSKSSGDGVPELRSLSTFGTYDALALIFIAVGLAISAAGGVGGGTILVPAMVLIMSFDIKRATPVSNLAIVGGAIANAWFNFRKRHPTVDRPLIDSDLALAMIPLVMGGAVVGTVFAKLLPSYLISLLFVVVLTLGGARTVSKGIKMHRKETNKGEQRESVFVTEAMGEQRQTTGYIGVYSPTSFDYVEKQTDGVDRESVRGSLCTADTEKLAQILERERQFSLPKQGVLLICYVGILAASLGSASVTCNSVAYWALLIAEIPWIAGFGVYTAIYLYRQHCCKLAVNYAFAVGDIHWTKKNVVRFPLACAGAGVIAGLFGVGGGIVTGPLMIEMGIVPEVASATTALMVLYSSAAATAQFAVFGLIAWDWALMMSALAFVVTAVSQVVILGFVRRTGRQSVIVLCIGVTICIGAVLMTYQSIVSTIEDAGEPFEVTVC
uniref:RxLR effector candidate protein n=1 Tax=Hyaloperonospora arabidopsidis (strain Emoy2) TaxID=559515 RepID=M4B456_HYAAE